MGWASEHSIKALCFDIDGTFYPKGQTNAYLLRSALAHPIFSLRYNSMRQKMRERDGYEAGPLLDLDAFRRKEMEILSYHGSFESYVAKYRKCLYEPWQKFMPRIIKVYSGVRDALVKAKEQGYILAALSDFPLEGKLEALGLAGLFDWQASTEDYGYLKPNARPFLQMLEELSLSPSDALYMGDSYRKDVIGGHKIGMRTLLLAPGGKAEDYPEADVVLTTWDSFARIILD